MSIKVISVLATTTVLSTASCGLTYKSSGDDAPIAQQQTKEDQQKNETKDNESKPASGTNQTKREELRSASGDRSPTSGSIKALALYSYGYGDTRCAILTNGFASCWGSGEYGLLGSAIARYQDAYWAMDISGLEQKRIVKLGPGSALTENGEVWSWGPRAFVGAANIPPVVTVNSSYHEKYSTYVPTHVRGLDEPVVALAASSSSKCVISGGNRTIKC